MMNSKLFTIGMVASSLFFASCEKDDSTDEGNSENNSSSTDQVTSIVISNSDTTFTHVPEYDANGRVIKAYNLLGAEISFDYNGNTVTQSDTWDTETTTFTLNADGEPESATSSEGDNITFTYNSNGNLIQEKEIQADSDVITDNYTWTNGDLTSMVSNQEYGTSTTNLTYAYTYGTQEAKGPALEFLEYYLFVSGYPSYGTYPTHVITGNASADYTYSFDSNGNITSVTDGNITVTFNF